MSGPLLELSDMRVEFRGKTETVVAVPGLSFSVAPGEAYGLVGESGCGKSTTAMAIMGYLGETGTVASGSIRFDGKELTGASHKTLQAIRVPSHRRGQELQRNGLSQGKIVSPVNLAHSPFPEDGDDAKSLQYQLPWHEPFCGR